MFPAALLMLVLFPVGRTLAQQSPRYNVLFLISDDLRPDITTYGGISITPNVDALGKVGVRFDRAYCQFALCNPSRSSMLNGRHPTTTMVLGNGQNFRRSHPEYISLPQLFKQN